MRRISPHIVLLSLLLLAFAGCSRGAVTAGSVTVAPKVTAATAASSEPDPDPTSVPTAMPPSLIDAAPTRVNSDDAVRAVSQLLERKVPTLPVRPRTGASEREALGTQTPESGTGLMLPTPTPSPAGDATRTPSKQPAQVEAVGVVNASVVNVRTGPGTVYAIASKVNRDEEISVSGRNEDGTWLQICCPAAGDEQQWIAADFIDLQIGRQGSLEEIPEVEAPPTPESVNVAAAAAPAPGSGAGAGLPGPGNFPAAGSTNPLTGKPLPGGRSAQRPVIVCINNDFAARPQFGTSQADVMYEYLMEGYGITRFSGIYYGGSSGQVGPVRSARLINYYMGALYDAGLVCSGASDQVRYLLKYEAPFPYLDIDLDDPSNARYSVSIGSDYRTRLRTATDKLRRWLADWNVERPASLRGFTFGDAPAGGEPGTSIAIPYPNGQVSYRYDSAGGRYLRSMSGAAHVDGNTGAQLALENVIVQVVPHQATDIVEDSLGSTSIRLNLFGSGQAIVFRDGKAYEGTWRSETRGDTPRFFDAAGQEIPLKAGHSWISIVPDGYGVTYQ